MVSKAIAGGGNVVSKNALGELIRQRRTVKRYTQSDLAKQLQYANQNFATSTISAWEHGRRPPVDDADFVNTLATILGISTVEIYKAAGIFRENRSMAMQQLMQILDNATPDQLDDIEKYAKFIITQPDA